MDNFNNQAQFNGYNQNNNFNNPNYINIPNNNQKKGNIGFIATVLQWVMYGFGIGILILMTVLWIATDFSDTGDAVIGLIMLEGMLQVIPGIILAIMQIMGLKQKMRPFVLISMVINIICVLIGLVMGGLVLLGLMVL